jgi:hypothetical protein
MTRALDGRQAAALLFAVLLLLLLASRLQG